MDKRTELMTTTKIVKKLLEVNPQTRSSDSYLYLKVLGVIEEANNINVNNIPVKVFLTHMAEWGFPPFESVRRARQKLQNRYPELSASAEVQTFRKENEQAVREYALGAIQ